MAASSDSVPEADEEICLQSGDVRLGMNGDIPTIDFAEHVLETLNRRMGFSVVVKLLGWTIGFWPLRSRLQSLWAPSGPFQLIDLDENCFLVKFRLEDDFQRALMNGPWIIFGHCLSVQPWTPSFNPRHHFISRIVTWIRLPYLPARYYHSDVIKSIGNTIGDVVKINYNTASGNRGRFARVTVMLDLTKPLIPRIQVDGEILFVEYEGIPSICFTCGRYGHSQEGCPVNHVAPGQDPRHPPTREIHTRESREDSVFGEWMIAQRKKRTFDRGTRPEAPARNQPSGSRFSVLNCVTTSDTGPQLAMTQLGSLQLAKRECGGKRHPKLLTKPSNPTSRRLQGQPSPIQSAYSTLQPTKPMPQRPS